VHVRAAEPVAQAVQAADVPAAVQAVQAAPVALVAQARLAAARERGQSRARSPR
jgi:hypothetical protein